MKITSLFIPRYKIFVTILLSSKTNWMKSRSDRLHPFPPLSATPITHLHSCSVLVQFFSRGGNCSHTNVSCPVGLIIGTRDIHIVTELFFEIAKHIHFSTCYISTITSVKKSTPSEFQLKLHDYNLSINT